LTDFGKQVVAEMNRLGMIVDVSHVSDKTFWDVLETGRAPVFASHSSCRAICRVPRNMTDEMIVAMAKKGGVIQINFNSAFLSQKSADADRPVKPATRAEDRAAPPPATLEDAVAHINHVVRLPGSMPSALAATSTASGACPPEWRTCRNFRTSRGHYWRKATPRRTSGKYIAAIPCG